MITIRWDKGCEPKYQTKHSVGADLVARHDVMLSAGKTSRVPVGVYIGSVSDDNDCELQVRGRSSLACKGILPGNGVGTIDPDYEGEICMILTNTSDENYQVKQGDRVGQLLQARVEKIPGLIHKTALRGKGGFGSTGS